MKPRSTRLAAVLALAVLALAGTGAPAREASPAPPAWVHYVEEKLIVDGVVYLPDASAGAHRPGIVLITVKPQRQAEFAEILDRFELTLAARTAAPTELMVEVPVGYETHWVAALRAQEFVRHARLKTIDIGP